MAEKMLPKIPLPALLVTARPAKKAKKRKPEAEKAAIKRLWIKQKDKPESTSVQPLSGGDN